MCAATTWADGDFGTRASRQVARRGLMSTTRFIWRKISPYQSAGLLRSLGWDRFWAPARMPAGRKSPFTRRGVCLGSRSAGTGERVALDRYQARSYQGPKIIILDRQFLSPIIFDRHPWTLHLWADERG